MNRRGSALLVTLAVLTGLVALVATLATGFDGDLKAQTDRMNARRARLMADSGLQRAIVELQSMTAGKTTLQDSWSSLVGKGATDYTLGSDTFRVQVIDLCSRINLNTADQATLKQLPLASDQVDTLMDWRESGTTPRATGAKDDYYNKLAKPYNAKLQTLGSVDELLLIKGFSPATLYDGSDHTPLCDLTTTDSISADLDPTGQPKIDVQSATLSQLTAIGVSPAVANTIIQSQGSFQKMGDVIALQGMDQASAKALLNFCTVGTPSPNGLININTASEAVLAAIPNMASDMASSIAARQQDGFVGLGDLVDIPGISLTSLPQIVDRLSISSKTFEVRVIGSAAGSYCAIEGELVIDDKGNVTVARQQPAPFIDAATRWHWPTTANQHETIGGPW